MDLSGLRDQQLLLLKDCLSETLAPVNRPIMDLSVLRDQQLLLKDCLSDTWATTPWHLSTIHHGPVWFDGQQLLLRDCLSEIQATTLWHLSTIHHGPVRVEGPTTSSPKRLLVRSLSHYTVAPVHHPPWTCPVWRTTTSPQRLLVRYLSHYTVAPVHRPPWTWPVWGTTNTQSPPKRWVLYSGVERDNEDMQEKCRFLLPTSKIWIGI
jgi:hypothetical protein